MANWLTKILPSWRKRTTEGAYRPGPYYLTDGFLSATAGRLWNFWQAGYSVQPYGSCNAMVEACVSAYSQTVAMCPGSHWRGMSDGGRERVDTSASALARVLKKPNDYQSISDLLLNVVRRLFEKGEAYCLVIRNDRAEISELHWMRNGYPRIGIDGSVFYELNGNQIVEQRLDLSAPIPARDVLHLRLHTPCHPLKGVSPIMAAALDLALSGAALNQQAALYVNQARPSFILETDQKLTTDETKDLRTRWDALTKGENSGGTPILSWGLKAKPVDVTAKDGQLAELLKMSDQNVALAFRMPLQVLGIGDTPFASTEALMSSWKATGLGFVLNHIEEAIGNLFRLKGFPDEYLELDTNALLRSSFKEMIDALTNGTQRVLTPNDARAFIDLPKKPGGDEILVQQQDIPLSMAGKMAAQLAAPKPEPTSEPADNNGAAQDDERLRHAFRAARARTLSLAA